MNISKCIISSTIIAALTTTTPLFADSTTPFYTAGGALSGLSAQTALNPMSNTQKPGWWYLTSMLHDQNNMPHSIQVNLFRVPVIFGAIGAGTIGFSFQNTSGTTEYLWTTYADQAMMSDFPAGEFNATPASDGKYSISINPFSFGNQNPGFDFEFKHDPTDTDHIAGELGAKYVLIAKGIAQVGASENNLQTVSYIFQATMTDTRGLLPEGYGGYVGPVSWQKQISQNVQGSWELAMPELKLSNWTMAIAPVGTITPNSPVQKTLQFTNGSSSQQDLMWLDRQVLYSANSNTMNQYVSGVKTFVQALQNGVKSPDISTLTSGSNGQELYHGTWMSFCLNKGAYKGYCGDIVGFWKPDVATAQMNSDSDATGGFMNLFLPIANNIKEAPQPGGELTESLSFASKMPATPYQIVNDPSSVFTSPLSGNHYAQTVYVTLRKGSPINAILNAKAGTSKDITLKFSTLSKQTENVMLTNSDAFYEGAATVSVCKKDHSCTPVGSGFVEQMGYSS